MKKIIILLAIMSVITSCKVGVQSILYIENVDEMEDTPSELYIVQGNKKYLYNTEENTMILVETY